MFGRQYNLFKTVNNCPVSETFVVVLPSFTNGISVANITRILAFGTYIIYHCKETCLHLNVFKKMFETAAPLSDMCCYVKRVEELHRCSASGGQICTEPNTVSVNMFNG